MSKEQRFCERISRIFSGDPSALLCADSQWTILASAVTPDLFAGAAFFQLDSNQVPNSQFWVIPRLDVLLYNGASALQNDPSNIHRVQLCNAGQVGSQVQSGDMTTFIPQNYGIEIATDTNFTNDAAANAGLEVRRYNGANPILVPPGWFLRYNILNSGLGAGTIPTGTIVLLRAVVCVVDKTFATLD
ncbi:MAG TPA: hypothetical protein VKJ65_12450 [Phycisphaerae bacterium]|nr:hypothetical protein [Phycisphaerae bacterium]